MIKAKQNTPTQKDLIPSGSHIARCYSMVHIGTVKWEYLGEQKQSDKIRLTWEFPKETKVFNEEKGEQPFVLSKEYNLSMHEKANLRKDLESWRGQAFTENEADNFDVTKLLGVPCMLSIIHKKSEKNGLIYDNIGNVSGIPQGINCPEQINPNFEFNYDDKFDLDWLSNQPDFIKEMIKSTPEYKERIEALEGQNELDNKMSSDAGCNDLPF